ncbi:hypothetical protein WISP_142600 [Willisornis vidua]|uniref:Uncharacterized protein n=1 Tax=Willisornis vidua TaxID=1566151 RepID=A0ABQ9CQY0_9PASS|nr:hypothetical protein WISP_142600 [Willisornis vidua]
MSISEIIVQLVGVEKNRDRAYTTTRTEPVPAGSKTDLLMAKAKTINDDGNTSEIKYLRPGKCYCTEAIADREKRSEKYVRATTLHTSRPVKKEGENMLQLPELIFHCSPW